MRFKFIVSKTANQFFFISNLAEWHFSCRKEYNQQWLNKTGPLKALEKKALKYFKTLLEKNNLSYKNKKEFKAGNSKFIGKIFYTTKESQTWRKLTKDFSRREAEQIKKIFGIFSSRFNKVWSPENNKRTMILKESMRQKNYQKIFQGVETFFGFKNREELINIIILYSPLDWDETSAGSANVGNSYITLELPHLKRNTWQLDFSIGIIAHEISHIFYRSSSSIDIAGKLIKKERLSSNIPSKLFPQRNAPEIVDEVITSSLVPSGYLAEKFNNFKPTDIHFSDSNMQAIGDAYNNLLNNKAASTSRIIKYFTWQLYPLVSYYINSKKTIDKNFISQVIKIVSTMGEKK